MEHKLLKLVIVVFLSVNLFSKDFLELYRTQCINAVEKELEKSLRDVNSWKKYLENKNVDYGFYETKEYVIVAQKNNKEMSVFAKNGDDFKKISKDNMIIGEKAGDKYLEGDKKTPEGSYDLVQKRTGLDQFYGPLALVTSYPNNFDQSLNKKGHGIWIHGMPLNGDRENYTQGCLALNNEKLKELEKNIDYKKTVLITSGDEFKKAKDDINNIIKYKYSYLDREYILERTLYLNIVSAFIWHNDKRTYIIDGKEVDAQRYWGYMNEKYKKECYK